MSLSPHWSSFPQANCTQYLVVSLLPPPTLLFYSLWFISLSCFYVNQSIWKMPIFQHSTSELPESNRVGKNKMAVLHTQPVGQWAAGTHWVWHQHLGLGPLEISSVAGFLGWHILGEEIISRCLSPERLCLHGQSLIRSTSPFPARLFLLLLARRPPASWMGVSLLQLPAGCQSTNNESGARRKASVIPCFWGHLLMPQVAKPAVAGLGAPGDPGSTACISVSASSELQFVVQSSVSSQCRWCH